MIAQIAAYKGVDLPHYITSSSRNFIRFFYNYQNMMENTFSHLYNLLTQLLPATYVSHAMLEVLRESIYYQ